MKTKTSKLFERFIARIILSIVLLIIIYSVKVLNFKHSPNILHVIRKQITYSVSVEEVFKNINLILDDISYKPNDNIQPNEPVILIDKEEF